jgi:3-deoxy-D-manno-octulosonic-acid transferase
VRLRRPVLSGPSVFNFASMFADLEARGLVRTVIDAGDLADGLAGPPVVNEAAVAALEAEADAPMNATLEALLPLIPRPLLDTSGSGR